MILYKLITEIQEASVSVSELGGKDIESVGVTETEINNVEFRIRSTEIEQSVHNLTTLRIWKMSLFLEFPPLLQTINGVKEFRVKSKSTELLEDILDATNGSFHIY